MITELAFSCKIDAIDDFFTLLKSKLFNNICKLEGISEYISES